MSDLQLGNQNERPQNLEQLEGNLNAAIEQRARETTQQNPSKFVKQTGGGTGMESGPGPSDLMSPAATSSSSSFFMMGGGGGGSGRRTKATRRFEQLSSRDSAMGLPKSYREMKDDHRTLQRLTAGKGKGNRDPLSGGGDKAIAKEVSSNVQLSGTSIGREVNTQGIGSNLDMARAMGAGSLVDTLSATRREKEAPTATAIVAGALHGDERKINALSTVDEGVKRDIVTSMASKETAEKLLKPKNDAQKDPFKDDGFKKEEAAKKEAEAKKAEEVKKEAEAKKAEDVKNDAVKAAALAGTKPPPAPKPPSAPKPPTGGPKPPTQYQS